jgi:hypothetical protein
MMNLHATGRRCTQLALAPAEHYSAVMQASLYQPRSRALVMNIRAVYKIKNEKSSADNKPHGVVARFVELCQGLCRKQYFMLQSRVAVRALNLSRLHSQL